MIKLDPPDEKFLRRINRERIMDSISKFIMAFAMLVIAISFACFTYRLIDFDHHPLINIRHSYDHTIYMRPPGLDQEVKPQPQDQT